MRSLRVLAFLALMVMPSAALGSPTIDELTTGITPNARPTGITAGPDGNLWFTELRSPGRIGRITTGGIVTEFTAGLTPNSWPTAITAGPDGNLWFTEQSDGIGRITPGGTITEFKAGITSNSWPTAITAGPDGNLWFTQVKNPGRIGRITTGGVVTEFTAGLTPNSWPTGITAGPEGNLWFTQQANPGRIGRITPAGVITEFSAGLTANSRPTEITAGPDGNLWFTQQANPGRIGRITPAGVITEFSAGLTPGSEPTGITAGPDGNLWFTEKADPGRIGRITPAGVITEYTAGLSLGSAPTGITAGPDGNLWFTEQADPGRIGRIGLTADSGTGGLRGPDPLQPVADRPGPAIALGRAVEATSSSGVIRVKTPRSSAFVPLQGSVGLPVGSVIDSRRGRVSIKSALPLGYRQTAAFWGGIFTVRQSRAGSGSLTLVVPGAVGCHRARTSAAFSQHARRRAARRQPSLWGRDHKGRYRTEGTNSVATVRGTLWQTVNRCDGTLTRVREGAVVVRDLRLRRNVRVTAGHSYLARRR